LLAFRLAAECGADVLHADVRRTHEGAFVLLADDDLTRTTDCIGLASAMGSAELDVCDAGYWFRPHGSARYPYRGLKIGIPRLDEFLLLLDGIASGLRLNLEIGADCTRDTGSARQLARQLVKTVDDAGWLSRTVFSSADRAVIDAAGQASLEARTEYVIGPAADVHVALEYAISRGHAQLQIASTILGAEGGGGDIVAAAHAAGVAINVWGVGEHAQVTEWARMGVDGIVTDDPERVRQLLGAC
jgi:glycerophosphoryl diester phosphodiesterase